MKIWLGIAAGVLLALQAAAGAHADAVRYYRSFASYYIPERPTKEITSPTPEVLATIPVYYVAHFDDEERLVCFEKMLDGKSHWLARYAYDGVTNHPTSREFVDNASGMWRRDAPWSDNLTYEGDVGIDEKVDISCP